jgi:hypothetical protein
MVRAAKISKIVVMHPIVLLLLLLSMYLTTDFLLNAIKNFMSEKLHQNVGFTWKQSAMYGIMFAVITYIMLKTIDYPILGLQKFL